MVQTVDFFTPIVNDPFKFGQIAAANALSDVYAMGGEPFSVMNIVCYPAKSGGVDGLREILRGGMDKIRESGAVLAGGHSVEDDEVKYGLSVSGTVDPTVYATNSGLRAGDVLLLTKPIGTGVLATSVKARWDGHDAHEELLWRCASRLNRGGGRVISELGLKAATDITGFGLGGHLIEMAAASGVQVELYVEDVPLLGPAAELAGMGLLPEGSLANRNHCSREIFIADGVDSVRRDLVFDAQTSGGLVLAVPADLVEEARTMLREFGELDAVIGRVRGPKVCGEPSLLLI